MGQKYTILRELMGHSVILSTHNVLCRKFAAVCGKITTFCPLTHDAAAA